MIENARGLALRTRPLTETSLIVSWLTAGCGRISTVARGARRPKSVFRGKLDLFYLADFSFVCSRRSDLHTLREVTLVDSHTFLRRDLAALRQASYCAALIEQTTEVETPLPGMLELMLGFLRSFSSAGESSEIGAPERVLAFELRLLEDLGLEPDWDAARISAPSRQAIERLKTAPWEQFPEIRLAGPAARELRQFLHGFLIYNFGRLARGRETAL